MLLAHLGASMAAICQSAFPRGNLAPESGDSAHWRLVGVRSRIYVGVAEKDPMFGGAEDGRLAAVLRDAGVDHVIENYAGAAHGFVMDDLPVANLAAASRHWLRLSTELREAFSRFKGASA
jgi:carboxymethylenebutenolidase